MTILQHLDADTLQRLLALRRRLEREEALLRDLQQRRALARAAAAGVLVYRPA